VAPLSRLASYKPNGESSSDEFARQSRLTRCATTVDGLRCGASSDPKSKKVARRKT
jgi:hypothetical protein